MKKIVLSLTAAAALSGFAIAGGDITPVTPAPADSWSGFYVGVQVGGVWGNSDLDYSLNGGPLLGYTRDLSPNGFAGGVFAGYNWITENNWLFGIEGDWNYLGGDDTGAWVNANTGVADPDWTQTIENEWDASLRLRIGKEMGDFMPYITGGFTWTKVTTKLDNYNSAPQHHYSGHDYSGHATLSGWTIGAGVEYLINSNFKARLQYRYSDYSNDTVRYYADDGSGDYADINIDHKSHILEAGFVYRF